MLKKLFKRAPKEASTQQALNSLAAHRHGEPGTRVHHEYGLHPAGEGFDWLARVYAQNGAINEKAGHAVSESLAREEALAWCAATVSTLKGV